MISPSRTNENGAGLLGLVFVILSLSIAGVLVMTLVTPGLVSRQAQETTAHAEALRGALQAYQFSHGGSAGTLPLTLDELRITDGTACTLDSNPTHSTYGFLQGWCGPYLDQEFSSNPASLQSDGWGTPFDYQSATGELRSCGMDRVCGGGDDLVFTN